MNNQKLMGVWLFKIYFYFLNFFVIVIFYVNFVCFFSLGLHRFSRHNIYILIQIRGGSISMFKMQQGCCKKIIKQGGVVINEFT